MKSFQSFQPGKSKSIGIAPTPQSADLVAKNAFADSKPPVSLFKTLLLQLNNNPFELSIASSELKESSVQKSTKYYSPTRKVIVEPISRISTSNPSLLRQLTIEANFDLRGVMEELKQPQLVSNSALVSDVYIYPSSQRMAENYAVAEYIADNICKPRHWTTREIELPYSRTSGNNSSADAVSGMLMIGSTTAATAAISTAANLHEDILSAVESRLLKWQDALHALLANLLNIGRFRSNSDSSKHFYMLGRSVVLPSSARLHLSGNSGPLPLPYTSAHFFTTDAKVSGAVTKEPACMLIGVQKVILLRLQQLHAEFLLVEDINSPLPLSKAEMSARGKSAVINIAHGKSSIDPHSSTAALFNSRKLGVDIILTGKYSVSVAAQVLKECVFDVLLFNSSRANPMDVPVLLGHTEFPHCSHISYDVKPLQCQFDFSSGSNELLRSPDVAASTTGMGVEVHRIQINGLIRSSFLEPLVRTLQERSARCDGTTYAAVGKKLSKSYAYMMSKDSVDKKINQFSAPVSADADAFTVGTGKPAIVVAPAPINPMILVTTSALNYEDSSNSSEDEEDNHENIEEHDSSALGKRGFTTKSNTSTTNRTNTKSFSAGAPELVPVSKKIKNNNNKDDNNADTSNAFSGTTSIGESGGTIRSEEWLKSQRETTSSGKYFLIQCSLMTPRMGQFSYAHSDCSLKSGDSEILADERNLEGLFQALDATHLIEEVRWSSHKNSNFISTTKPGNAEKKDLPVEVVCHVLPPARLRRLITDSATSNKDQDEDSAENGMVLDALNKYSIFVDNKAM